MVTEEIRKEGVERRTEDGVANLKFSITSRRLKGVASLVATAEHEKKVTEIECSQNILRLISSRPKTTSVNESAKLEMPSLTGIRGRRPG